jgi:hypothetical protein
MNYETISLFLQIFVKIHMVINHGGKIVNPTNNLSSSKIPQRPLGEFLRTAGLLNHHALKVHGFESGLKVPLKTKTTSIVILAKAGIQNWQKPLDSRLRGNDEGE